MSFVEKKIQEECVYEGPIFQVYHNLVELPNGVAAPRDRITHRGGAGMVALDREDHIYLVRQYRHGVEKELLEIPAGKLEAGEDPAKTVVRELEEEVGFTSNKVTSLGYMELSPAYLQEITYLYLGQDLIPHKEELDEDEFLNIREVPLEELVDDIMKGKIADGKTQVAILKVARM